MAAEERDDRLAALDVFVGEWIEQVEVPDARRAGAPSSGICEARSWSSARSAHYRSFRTA